ncbi:MULTISPECIES: hydrogenase maturation protease [Methylotuvimicrobium]|uniref:Enzyme n=1 Tax=Methylotuvimicrobium alcaliphilum (strain DSM 19304 / NCIMB 14124 / VKM B-2133 / 20Z) TaxID=1091494 RepID=G4SY71_META2|nr:hydrogenase maturation protease [Methylotuvimicrobium alcaliphilum]CCE25380.1 putative enzyme [Methylotuvimicrobium alcaliphilum 20Z]
MSNRQLCHIVCFGNPLHGDDGFGPAVYQRLAALPLPDNVRVFDAGTPGLAALALFQGCHEVMVVDAVASGGIPGKLSRLSPNVVTAEITLPGHGIGVGYLLKAVAALPDCPRIEIIAAEILGAAPFRPGLSKPVRQAVDDAFVLLEKYAEQVSRQ